MNMFFAGNDYRVVDRTTFPKSSIAFSNIWGVADESLFDDALLALDRVHATRKPWFKDTLFVIVADHCALAAGKTRLPVAGYRIPMISYAPDLLKPGRVERVVSQLDVPPTLLETLGLPGDDDFFGQSVFEKNQMAPRAFISNYQELGYYKNDALIVLGPKKRADAFHIDPQTLAAKPAAMDEQLLNEAIAYYQSTFHAFKRGEMRLH